MNRRFLGLLIAVVAVLTSFAQRTVLLVNREWKYCQGDDMNAVAAPSWTLDVERTLQIAEIHAAFKQSVSTVVEVSKDQKTWVKVADIADGQRVDLNLDPMESARFIRFSFKAQSRPQLLEAFMKGYVQ